MRAAFLAVQGGKQVAVLVPTTLLAQQHFQNFSDRFADWPVRVESLSRFRTAKEQKQILDGLAQGHRRHRHRHPQTAAARHQVQGSRSGHRRRGASLRRAPEGTAQGAARLGGHADAHRHADSAHAEHVPVGPARPVHHRHATGGPSPHQDLRQSVERRPHQGGLPARDRPRRPGVLPAQRGADHREERLEQVQQAGARRARGRRPRADARARSGTGHARLLPPAFQRAGVQHHHRIRHRRAHRQHHHHRPRRQAWTRPAAPVARPRRALPSPRLCLPDHPTAAQP